MIRDEIALEFCKCFFQNEKTYLDIIGTVQRADTTTFRVVCALGFGFADEFIKQSKETQNEKTNDHGSYDPTTL